MTNQPAGAAMSGLTPEQIQEGKRLWAEYQRCEANSEPEGDRYTHEEYATKVITKIRAWELWSVWRNTHTDALLAAAERAAKFGDANLVMVTTSVLDDLASLRAQLAAREQQDETLRGEILGKQRMAASVEQMEGLRGDRNMQRESFYRGQVAAYGDVLELLKSSPSVPPQTTETRG